MIGHVRSESAPRSSNAGVVSGVGGVSGAATSSTKRPGGSSPSSSRHQRYSDEIDTPRQSANSPAVRSEASQSRTSVRRASGERTTATMRLLSSALHLDRPGEQRATVAARASPAAYRQSTSMKSSAGFNSVIGCSSARNPDGRLARSRTPPIGCRPLFGAQREPMGSQSAFLSRGSPST